MNHIKRSLSLGLSVLVSILAMAFSAQATDPGCTNLIKFSRKVGYFPIEVAHIFYGGGSSNLTSTQISNGYPGQVAHRDEFTIVYAACPGTTTNSTEYGYQGENPIWGYKGFYSTNIVVSVKSETWFTGHNRATYKASSCCEGYSSPGLSFTHVSNTSLCDQNNSIIPGDEELLSMALSAIEEESDTETAPEPQMPIIDNGIILDWEAYKVWWEVNNGTYQD